MSDGDKYRRFAEECMRLSDKAKNLQDQASLLAMAQEWFNLAIKADAAEAPNGGNGKGSAKKKPPGEGPSGFYNRGNGVPGGTGCQSLRSGFVPAFRNSSNRTALGLRFH